MPKLKLLNSLLLTIMTVLIATKAQANCSQTTAKLELVQPAMERYFQQLQQKTQFPWGKVQPYGKLSGDRITLTPEFDRLTGNQKQQVLELLISPGYSLFNEQEKAESLKNSDFLGALPYSVFANDGRAVSIVYDGCIGNVTLLTEFSRYQMDWYSRPLPNRQIRFPISPAQEKAVKKNFWRTVGYKQQDIQWIAWVPERGYFEINVYNDAINRYQRRLNKFWQVAPQKYRYVVLDQNGNLLLNHN